VLKGSYDGTTWTVVDERTGEVFPWRRQTRPFKVSRPGRYTYYRLDVTQNTGDPTTALAEVELLAKPDSPCTATVSGQHSGDLVVADGVVCLAAGSTVTGAVTVRPGASLYAIDATVNGSLAAAGAGAVVLVHTTVGGALAITGRTDEVSLEDTTVGGPVALSNNIGGLPALVSFDRIGGPLACAGNSPPPVNNGLPNTVNGPRAGQCATL
jgi:hypothetical protein